jgi:hypothetical protein
MTPAMAHPGKRLYAIKHTNTTDDATYNSHQFLLPAWFHMTSIVQRAVDISAILITDFIFFNPFRFIFWNVAKAITVNAELEARRFIAGPVTSGTFNPERPQITSIVRPFIDRAGVVSFSTTVGGSGHYNLSFSVSQASIIASSSSSVNPPHIISSIII